MYYRSPLFTRRLKNQLCFGIISSLEALPVYKTSCLCGIMFRDKYLDLYSHAFVRYDNLIEVYNNDIYCTNVHNLGQYVPIEF